LPAPPDDGIDYDQHVRDASAWVSDPDFDRLPVSWQHLSLQLGIVLDQFADRLTPDVLERVKQHRSKSVLGIGS
tara:strand:+ start:1009 stop:1230 length:222 start_codon:yes stop_codon:yes gene_type:complete